MGDLSAGQEYPTFGATPAELDGFFARSDAEHLSGSIFGEAIGTRYMQATLTAQVEGDIGHLQCQVVVAPRPDIAYANNNANVSRLDVDTHLTHGSATPENPAGFTFANCFSITDGSARFFFVKFISRDGSTVHPELVKQISMRLETLADDDGGRVVDLRFPERTYNSGDRLWIGVVSEFQPKVRAISFTHQALTLSNADDTIGREIEDAAGTSTSPAFHVAFSAAQTDWWRFENGFLVARRDMRQAHVHITIPTLVRSNIVELWRYRDGEVSRQVWNYGGDTAVA